MTPAEIRNDDERRAGLRAALENQFLKEAMLALMLHGPLERGIGPALSEASAHIWLGEAKGHRGFYFDLFAMATVPPDREQPEETYQSRVSNDE